jgi:hypothetical protein
MTTDPALRRRRRRSGSLVVPVTTAVAATSAAAAVAWAAATPVRTAPAAPNPAPIGEPVSSATQQELASLARSLAGVRRDLIRVSDAHLPKAAGQSMTAPTMTGAAGGVPPIALPGPLVVAPVAASAPAAHTSTGASGAVVH